MLLKRIVSFFSLSFLMSCHGISKTELEKSFKDPLVVQLTAAAVDNKLPDVNKFLTEQHVDVNYYGKGGLRPLHYAILYSNPETISDLIRAGADPLALAYGKGTPFSFLFTSSKPFEEKIARTRALVAGGFDISQPGFIEELNTTVGLLVLNTEADRKARADWIRELLQLGLKREALDHGLSPPFSALTSPSYPDVVLLLLQEGFPLFEAGQVDYSLAHAAYRTRFDKTTKDSHWVPLLNEALRQRGVEVETLREKYGTDGNWQWYYKNRPELQAHGVQFFLEKSANNHPELVIPTSMTMPMILTVKTSGEEQDNNRHIYFDHAMNYLELVKYTSFERAQTFVQNKEYLHKLQPQFVANKICLVFDAVELFPEWKTLISQRADPDSILVLSAQFSQKVGGRNRPRETRKYFATNGTESPLFEQNGTESK